MDAFQFVITNVLMLSVGTVIYMSVRTLPRIEEDLAAGKKGMFERWITSEVPEKIDKMLNGFLFKTMKKARVLLLRFDNTLGEQLKKIRPDGNGNGKQNTHPGFKDITGEGNSEQVAKESDLTHNN